LEIEFELKEKDIVAFSEHYSKYSKTQRWIRWFTLCIGVVVVWALVLIYIFISEGGSPEKVTLIITLVVLSVYTLLWFLIVPFLLKKWKKKLILKQLSEGDNKGLLGKTRLEFNDQGIFGESESTRLKLNWDIVNNIEETEDHIFIYVSTVSAITIPKRSFKKKSEIKKLRKELNQYIDQS
jgi:hypothetical protein